jgi:hypothetical protein
VDFNYLGERQQQAQNELKIQKNEAELSYCSSYFREMRWSLAKKSIAGKLS